MPIHDWTRVPSGLFHHFHQFWSVEICRKLNRERLPAEYYAILEQRSGTKETDVLAVELDEPEDKANRITIRHHLGQIVAFIEIVSPGNKDGERALDSFVGKIAAAMQQGIHVLVLDLFPPTKRDPNGIHKVIWDQFDCEEFELPTGQDRVFASYEADGVQTAHIETLGLGDRLPDMPLFIAPGAHVLVPLEDAYMNAWEDTPPAIRRLVAAG